MVNEWIVVAFVAGVALDAILGDPVWLPHPIVGYGKVISALEHRFNKGSQQRRLRNGRLVTLVLIVAIFILSAAAMAGLYALSPFLAFLAVTVTVFYCLAGTTLIKEVRDVFRAVDRSTEEGRRQVGRIVGRDTGCLDDNEVRTAALETLAENLSDGVIAPLFWFALLGVPGMLTYKMINTLDSMIGYKSDRYLYFGRLAAKIDDAANYIPARLTAWIMVLVSGRWRLISFVRRYGRCHASPNSGYPEAALAGILDCRFGGPHDYFGKEVWKPYIGETARELTTEDMKISLKVCRNSIAVAVFLTAIAISFLQ